MERVQVEKDNEGRLLTVNFDDMLQADLGANAGFRKAYLREAVGCMLTGEVNVGRSMLRKYVNGTVGFIPLGKALGRSPKTLMQMLGPKGNPHIRNFFEIVAYLQKMEGSVFEWQEQEREQDAA